MTGFDTSKITSVRMLSNGSKALLLGVCVAAAMAQNGRPPIEIHRSAALQAETDRMMASAISPARDGSCFGSQLSDLAHGARIAQATVLVAIVGEDSRVISAGTGTIVSGSDLAEGSPKRILTAEHVIDDARAMKGAKIAIAGSDGRFLAIAEPTRPSTYTPTATYGARGDIAVLAPVSFMPEGKVAYEAIKGLAIAPGFGTTRTPLSGLAGLPAGIDHGVSGAPILDPEGRIRGVVTTAMQYPSTLAKVDRVPFTSGDIMAMSMAQDGVFRTAERSLPGSGTFYGEAIPADLAASLIGTQDSPDDVDGHADEAFIATIAGFPSLSCVVYEAVVGPSPTDGHETVSYRSPGR